MKAFFPQIIFCFCLFLFPLGVWAESFSDEDVSVPSATMVHSFPDIVPEPRILEGTIVGERSDMNVFLDVDTLRSLLLFTGDNGRSIEAVSSISGEVRTMFDVCDRNSFYGYVPAAYVLPDGEWLIYESRDNEANRLWKYNPDSRNLRCVFTFRNPYQILAKEWSYEYAPDSRTIYISEYGSSKDNPVDPNDPEGKRHLGYKAGATAIWHSTDMGETWSVLHDFADDGDIYYERFHIHAVHYDRKLHRLYATTGDAVDSKGNSNKRLYWTDDFKNWKHRDWKYYWGTTNDASSHAQMVSLVAADGFIIAGGDDFNNCIYRINKCDNPEDMELEPVLRYDASVTGLITQYTERFVQLPNGLILVYVDGGDGWAFPRQARILATYDGRQWYQIFTGPLEEDADHLLRREQVMRWWRGHLFFSCSRMVEGEERAVFYEMEVPDIPIPSGLDVPSLLHAPAATFTLDGRKALPGQKGIVIEGADKVVRK